MSYYLWLLTLFIYKLMETKYDDFDLEQIRILKTSKNGSKITIFKIIDSNSEGFNIKTPPLYMPWTVTPKMFFNKMNANIAIYTDDDFKKFIDSFDKKINLLLKDNDIKIKITNSVTQTGTYPATFKAKINFKDDEMVLNVLDTKRKPVDASHLIKKSRCAMYIKPVHVWLNDSKAGITWTCEKVIVKKYTEPEQASENNDTCEMSIKRMKFNK